jgi:hypothetical protein
MITAPPSLFSGSSTDIIKRVENSGSFAWLDDHDTVKAKKTAKLTAFFTILTPTDIPQFKSIRFAAVLTSFLRRQSFLGPVANIFGGRDYPLRIFIFMLY